MEARHPHGDVTMDHSEMGHDDHGSGGGGGGHDMGMMVIFQNLLRTSLYSEAWTPTNAGTYAATCIFLIFLASLLRALLAGRAMLEQRWLDRELQRRYVVVADKNTLSQRLSSDSLAKQAVVLSENGREENVTVVQRKRGIARPWRLSVDPVRAAVDTVIAGVGYLLMLAVMSMNVGYFLSVLGGVFLGSVLVGRFAVSSDH